jgi:hypothetical protein
VVQADFIGGPKVAAGKRQVHHQKEKEQPDGEQAKRE